MIRPLHILLLAVGLCGCTDEARDVGPTLPQTRPNGDDDPRIPAYQNTLDRVSQGARYFAWYGCSGCHGDGAPGVLNLADDRWKAGGGFAHVFASIADRHGRLRYGARIPMDQLWQLTAYVRDLHAHYPEKRARLASDQRAEPQGSTWGGPQ